MGELVNSSKDVSLSAAIRPRLGSLIASAMAICATGMMFSPDTASAAESRYHRLMPAPTLQFAARNANEFLIVDCLLPGQLRKLGRMATFVTARRPIKTSVRDCEIRGGEYVAEDRGSYGHALKVWLPKAKSGDPKAQTFVGEIFEKGLGLEPNFQTAALWYQKAAEQGDPTAQINLGNLYEKGLGVPKDPKKALEWYRRASGLGNVGLEFVPAGQVSEVKQLRSEVARQRQESEQLRGQVQRLQRQLNETRRRLERRRSDATRERRRLDRANRALRAEKSKYAQERRSLDAQRQRLAQLEAAYNQRLQSVPQNTGGDAAEIRSAQAKLKQEQSKVAQLEAALNRLRADVAQREARAVDRRELQAERNRIAQVERDYQRQLKELEAARRQTESKLSQQDRARAAEMRNKLNALRAELEGRSKRINDQNSKLAAKEKEIAAKTQQLAKLNNELTRLKSQAEQRRTQLAKLTINAEKQPAKTNGPTIELIDPKLNFVTRGLPVVRMRGATKSRVIVGRVKSATGLMTLVVNDREHKVDKQGLFRSRVPVLAKGTRVSIIAIDRRGKKSDLEFMLQPPGQQVKNKTGLESAFASALRLPKVNFGSYHALVIGNNENRFMPKLDTAVNDAKVVSRLLKARYGFKVTTLLNATRYDILSALNKLRKTLTEKDNLLIYYAGHGELDKVNQRGHWLPVDAEPNSTANWISNVNITDVLNAMNAKQIMVVADSCYSGALTRSALARLEAGMSNEARATWVTTILKKRSRVAMTSGGLQPVLDAGGGGHSIFAKAFIDVLKTNRGVLEARRVHQEVSARVTYAADAFRYDQLPEYAPIKHAGHGGGEFFFVAQGS